MSVKIKLNREGVRELLQSQEIMDACYEVAQSVQSAAGDGYEISGYVGQSRVNVSVVAVSDEAKKDNLENNTLLKAAGH